MDKLFAQKRAVATPCRDAGKLAKHIALSLTEQAGNISFDMAPFQRAKNLIYGIKPRKRGIYVALLVHDQLLQYGQAECAMHFIRTMFYKQGKHAQD